MIKLFDDKLRNDNEPSKHNENEYNYIDKSSRDIIAQAREKLNYWFKDYPDEEKRELKIRFENKFGSTFFELYLYSIFKKIGFTIKIHPSVPNSNKRPDFLVSKDGLEIYIEAKTISSKSEKEKAETRKINQLFDDINSTNLNNVLLLLNELQLKNNKQPSAKKIKQEILKKISSFDLEKICEKFELGKIFNLPNVIIDNEDIYLEASLIKLKSEISNSKENCTIGSYPFENLESGEEILKKAISLKAKRYGKLDKPFLVCLNSLDYQTSNKFSIYNAIWGSETITYSTNPNNRNPRMVRKPNGTFYSIKPHLKNLSGVLITNANPYNLDTLKHFLFKHPFSENNFEFNKLGFSYEFLNKTQLKKGKGIKLNEISV